MTLAHIGVEPGRREGRNFRGFEKDPAAGRAAGDHPRLRLYPGRVPGPGG